MAYTAACQMACGYCFQRGRNLKSHHSPRVFQATLNFIRDHLSSHPGLERVHLGLFGGEPLVDVAMASAYVDHLQRIAREYGLPLDISLTSNGLNLNRQLVLDWLPKGLKYVRVTLDGPPRVHDRRRPGRGNQPTFQRILHNLLQIRDLQGFGLGASINLDADNADYVEELLEILVEVGLQSEVEILLEATLPTLEGGAGDPILEEHRSQGQIMSRALDQVILKGFRTPIYPGLCLPCNFVQSNNFIIDWSGQLFRCTFTMLDPQARVGSVTEGVSPRNHDLLQSRKVVAGCREKQCAYLPLCGGGCRYEAHLRGGDWSASCCLIEFWDEVLPRSLLHNLQALAIPK